MAKKYVILFIASIFFLRLLCVGFCQSVNSKASLACCLGKSHSSDNGPYHCAQERGENCFSHCAKQKLDIIKTEQNPEKNIKNPAFLDNKSSQTLQNYPSNHSLTRNRYLEQIINKLTIRQIHFTVIFNHGPP